MTFDNKLSELLDIDPPEQEVLEPAFKNKEIDDDYDYARRNLRGLIDSGMNDLNSVMDIARQSESPRAFEVATNLIKTLADTNKDLLDLAKKKKDLTQEKNTQTVTNALFVGSTADLQKLIQGKST